MQLVNKDACITTACNDKANIMGWVDLEVILGHKLCQIEDYVVDGLDRELILGDTFLHKYGAILSMADRTLHFHDEAVFKPLVSSRTPRISVLFVAKADECTHAHNMGSLVVLV